MKRENGGIILSASDLMRFQGCRHATTLDLGWLDRAEHPPTCGSPKPAEDDESAELLQKKGDAHERAFLAEMKAAGTNVEEIETKRATFDMAHAMTVAAMKVGSRSSFRRH